MLLYGFMFICGLSSLVALYDWRKGCYGWILIAAIQDPVRKLIPGSPGILVLATVPVWLAIIIGALGRERGMLGQFRREYPKLVTIISLFMLSMVPAAVISATYGEGSWQLTLVGLFSYMSVLIGMVIGFAYPRRSSDLIKLLGFYSVISGFMMSGTLMEYLGIRSGWRALGTEAMGFQWVRSHTGYAVGLIAGFYRSPDVMGWHAVTTAMLASTLALRSKGLNRAIWLGITAAGVVGALLCGRRKMFLMLPLFALAMFWMYWRSRHRDRLSAVLAVIVLSCIIVFAVYQQIGSNPELERYYFSESDEVAERIYTHMFSVLVVTYQQSGFFGEGLGTATQGTHHLHVERPRTWQEGGLSRMLVELGVPGFICFLALAIILFATIISVITRYDKVSPDFPIYAGLSGLFFANAGSFIVSHQIFGDPFINAFFAFLIGLIFSGARIILTSTSEEVLYSRPMRMSRQPRSSLKPA
jgi:hypothetical protein